MSKLDLFPPTAGVNDDSEEESEEGTETRRGNDGAPSGPPLPRIVGLGLCSVFELIRETWIEQPSLCRRALKALLDMLQVANYGSMTNLLVTMPKKKFAVN